MELTPEQQAGSIQPEISADTDGQLFRTRRCLIPTNPVLDHGFVRVIDYMGDDAAVVQAAEYPMARELRRFGRCRSN